METKTKIYIGIGAAVLVIGGGLLYYRSVKKKNELGKSTDEFDIDSIDIDSIGDESPQFEAPDGTMSQYPTTHASCKHLNSFVRATGGSGGVHWVYGSSSTPPHECKKTHWKNKTSDPDYAYAKSKLIPLSEFNLIQTINRKIT
jgi:hypothetical protein